MTTETPRFWECPSHGIQPWHVLKGSKRLPHCRQCGAALTKQAAESGLWVTVDAKRGEDRIHF